MYILASQRRNTRRHAHREKERETDRQTDRVRNRNRETERDREDRAWGKNEDGKLDCTALTSATHMPYVVQHCEVCVAKREASGS